MSGGRRPGSAWLSPIFRRLFPGPLGADVCADLEHEYLERRDRGAGRALAALWYLGHLFLPSTWRLAFELHVRRGSAAGSASRSDVSADGLERPPYWSAVWASSLVFALYVVTLAPSTAFWDASEYIATAHIMGVPHPPGNPLFLVLARAWEVLLTPLGLSVAVRINLFSAFMSAAAHGFWFLIVHRVLGSFGLPERARLLGSAAAVLVSATAFTVWNQSNVNEKVYTVALFTIALLTWLVFRWRERPAANAKLLVLIAFILGLSVGNHLMALLAAPAIAVFVLVVRPRTAIDWKLYPPVVVAGLLGLSIHLVLPLRGALDPVINQSQITCPGIGSALGSIVTYGRVGCETLSDAITRKMYLADEAQWWPRKSPLSAQLLNYLQYFDWQWARSVEGRAAFFSWLRAPFTLLFAVLGLWGALEHQRRDRLSFYYVTVLFATVSAALVYYLNFRYGSGAPAPAGVIREVRERDYFFLISFSVWGLWAGIGLVAAWHRLGRKLGGLRWASPVMLLALMPLALNWSWASRANDYAARSWAYDLLMSVEPYGVLMTNGDNDTFPLWYLQEVEGVRRDVTVIVWTYLNTSWYPKQLQAMTAPGKQRPFEAAQARGVYPEAPAAPKHAILALSHEQIDTVTGVRLDRDVVVPFPGLAISYPAGTGLPRSHRMALQIMHDSIDERPIYFSSSSGFMRELGLDAFAVRQGLVAKLVLRPLDEPQPNAFERASPEAGGEWFDHPRSVDLYDRVYDFSGYRDRAVWSDPANQMPLQYWLLALQLSDVERKRGASESRVRALMRDAEEFWLAGQGGTSAPRTQ